MNYYRGIGYLLNLVKMLLPQSEYMNSYVLQYIVKKRRRGAGY
jgi:hypothetical protein